MRIKLPWDQLPCPFNFLGTVDMYAAEWYASGPSPAPRNGSALCKGQAPCPQPTATSACDMLRVNIGSDMWLAVCALQCKRMAAGWLAPLYMTQYYNVLTARCMFDG